MIALIICKEDYIKDLAYPIWIEELTHDSNNIPPVHSHEFIELVYVVDGFAKHTFEDQDSDYLGAGDMFIIYPGERHTFSIPPSNELAIINCLFLPELIRDTCIVEFDLSRSINNYVTQPLLNVEKRLDPLIKLPKPDSNRIKEILQIMKEELNTKTSGSLTIIRLRLLEILVLLSRISNQEQHTSFTKKSSSNARDNEMKLLIKDINQYLLQHYNEKISTSVLANVFNISVRHLNRVYKEYTGLTITEMIHQIRIDKAKYYLKHSDEKVINVAMKIGYDDPAFFSHLFRRKVGCSPGNYKRNNGSMDR